MTRAARPGSISLFFVSYVEEGQPASAAPVPYPVFARTRWQARREFEAQTPQAVQGNWTLHIERASAERLAAERGRAAAQYRRLGEAWWPCCELAVLGISTYECPIHGKRPVLRHS